MPNEVKLLPCENTDRELWRETEGDYYANSIHVTAQGGIGINVGGTVVVKTLREWHSLSRPTTVVAGERQDLGAIPGSREPDPSFTGSGPSGFDPERWQPIETAPKDGTAILLYWPRYAYSTGEETCPLVAVGSWKTNSRLETTYSNGGAKYSPEETRQIEAKYASAYFSDNDESDDYGLAEPDHAPTHWMPLPDPPERTGA